MSGFLAPGFDPAAFASKVVIADANSPVGGSERSRAEVVVQEISTHLGKVTDGLEKHIAQHQDILMQEMGNIDEIRVNTNVLNIRSKELRRCIDKIKMEVRIQ